MGNTDSVVVQQRLARFRPEERPVVEGLFEKLQQGSSSAVTGKPKTFLELDTLKVVIVQNSHCTVYLCLPFNTFCFR